MWEGAGGVGPLPSLPTAGEGIRALGPSALTLLSSSSTMGLSSREAGSRLRSGTMKLCTARCQLSPLETMISLFLKP